MAQGLPGEIGQGFHRFRATHVAAAAGSLDAECADLRGDAFGTADTAVRVAAERRRRAAEPIGVYPDSAGLQPLGGAKGATDVRSPHACRQTVGCVIRDLKGFLFGVEGDDRQYRTEDFFACY